ncbi:lipoprotein-releasing ABC transporter permease subunit [Candidatus Magnetomonas plexicatena]|uniref:lipoprotein-releasing ABC transporter permease subunit n=1 Tax=Candidatus Magnetomonas plexicatena TaxID=2552947 RepID=UPI001103E2DB|nr:lipoprotein-releasing ABC transporter permease subunit [Nitrospirales bacterium LBB_01]
MKLPYSFAIALRYLKSKKKHKSVSFNTIISVGGVALGVMALIIVLSVMSGFHEDLQRKILGVNTHLLVLSHEGKIPDYEELAAKIKKFPHVEATAPFVLGQVMVSQGKRAQGVYMRGVSPEHEKNVTDLKKYIKNGSLEALNKTEDGIVIGVELAGNLGVTDGDYVNIISPVGEIGPLGMVPKARKFKVVAIFEIGMYEYDSSLTITNMAAAQKFFGMGDTASGVQVKLDDIYKASEVRETLNTALGFPYRARDWMQMNRNLFSALKLEKFAMFVILTLIVIVAAFNIISTLIMNVMEKEREISILKAMGATNSGIMAIFMIQGFLVGLTGTLIGVTGGAITCYLLDSYELIKLPPDVYYLSHLPVKWKLSDFVLVSVSALTISFLSTIYPAYQAAKLDPIEPLRFK